MTVPAKVLSEAGEADVVRLTLRPGRAEGQTVAVFLHLLYLHAHRGRTERTRSPSAGRKQHVGLAAKSQQVLNRISGS